MHDSLAQVLSFVNTKAQAVEEYLRSENTDSARQQMAELSAAARQLYAEIREGIAALRVDMSGRTFRQVIEEQAQQFADSSKLRVSVNWSGDEIGLPLTPTGEVQLLRIVQEALANIRRHAAAGAVHITISASPHDFILTVEDDGKGFDVFHSGTDGRSHFGLQTMTERAHGIGGQLAIDSAPGEGTRINVNIPSLASAQPGGGA